MTWEEQLCACALSEASLTVPTGGIALTDAQRLANFAAIESCE